VTVAAATDNDALLTGRTQCHKHLICSNALSEGGAMTAPGWYPDPHDPNGLVYWDGHRWTGHRSRAPQRSIKPKRTVYAVIGLGVTVLVVLGLLALRGLSGPSESFELGQEYASKALPFVNNGMNKSTACDMALDMAVEFDRNARGNDFENDEYLKGCIGGLNDLLGE
jgi:hypothetical protein